MEVCALDLREHQLCAKFSKCEILAGSSGILRPCDIYRWYSSGSKEDRSHIRVAKVDNNHGSGFLSLVGYYRRFMKEFSKIAAPLIRLSQKMSSLFRLTDVRAFPVA